VAQSPSGDAVFELPAYLAEIDRVRSALTGASSPETARATAAAVPDRWWVSVDGQVTILDMRWIDDEIAPAVGKPDNWPAARQRVDRRLATMRAAGSDGSAAIGTSATELNEALQSVLARPEFHRSPTSRWLEEQRNRFGAWIMRMLDRLSGTGLDGRTIAIGLAWTLSLITLAALGWWLAAMLTRRSEAAALELGAAPPHRPPAREWALRALAAARAGDIREAIRCGYHAALCRIEEQGTWQVDETRTPREYLALIDRDDPRRPMLHDLTRQFEVVWYGRRTGTGDDVQRMSAHLERLGCLRESERAI
jgi:hypothetical protein